MTFMDNMRGKFTQASQSTLQKAKDFSEIKRLEIAITEVEEQINELYGKIGFEVYSAYYDSPLPEVTDLINEVTKLHQTIQTYNDQIKAINSANTCPQCGASIRKGMAFCGTCGCRLIEEKTQETEQKMFCEKCGAEIAPDSLFCSSCGNKINP